MIAVMAAFAYPYPLFEAREREIHRAIPITASPTTKRGRERNMMPTSTIAPPVV